MPKRSFSAHAATEYYVSQSGGNDNWPGTRSQPWKTLSEVSRRTFLPGDTINLKCGDTWINETLYLKGNSDCDNWITVQSYDFGAKPKIQPGSNFNEAIKIASDNSIGANGGWKITGLELCNAKNGVTMIDLRTSGGILNGLWVDDCYIHNMTGMYLVNPANAPTGYSWSTSVRTYSSDINRAIYNVLITNNTIDYCVYGLSMWSMNQFNFSNNIISHSDRIGLELCMDRSGVISGGKVEYSGYVGVNSGTAGIEIDSEVYDVTLQNMEICNTVAPIYNVDGCGVDYEGDNHNVTTIGCNIHDNVGRAFLIMGTSGECTQSNIQNNTCTNNGTISGEPAFIFYNTTYQSNGGTISGNIINKNSGQSLNMINGALTESWPAGFTISNNTVNSSGSSTNNLPTPVLRTV